MPLLSLDQVRAFRGSKALFDPVTFDVEQGGIALINANNGTGKTTLMDCIAGLHHNWTGSLRRPRGEISYLVQTGSYVKTLPLREQARLVVGFDSHRYSELVERLLLDKRDHVLFSLLSGGELQRAKLVLVLLRRHKVLLLDEPLANIDPISRDAVVAELEKTSPERATVIVSHPRDSAGVHLKGSVTLELFNQEH